MSTPAWIAIVALIAMVLLPIVWFVASSAEADARNSHTQGE